MKRFKAFTLVELLVVISIIAMLLAILMPSLQKARGSAQKIVCLSNTRTASHASMMYAADNKDRFSLHRGTALWVDWHSYLVPYLSKQQYKTNSELYWPPSTQQDRMKYFKPWWDLGCPKEKTRIPRTNIDTPLIYGYHMAGPYPFGDVVPLYSKGYGIYDFSSSLGKSRKTTEVVSSGLLFAEMLNTDYVWATMVTVDGQRGHDPTILMDLSDRHPGGNAGAFCDGHVESIRGRAFRDTHSPFWKVKR